MTERPINLRSSLGFNDPYFRINREERNVAALFYNLLLLGNNLETFLKKIDQKGNDNNNDRSADKYEVYYEYAFVRDLWKYIEKNKKVIEANRLKYDFIFNFLKDKLKINAPHCDLNDPESIKTFNSKFCTTTAASKKHIVSPSNWNAATIHNNFQEDDFKQLCKFKWCFNAKPDLVIHVSKDTAYCIEAKWESKEGVYPSSSSEKLLFKGKYVRQLDIQKMLMSQVLGLTNVNYILISMSGSEKTVGDQETIELSWNYAFENLKSENSLNFVDHWIDQIKKDSLAAKEKKQK
jgi:hypothetical protein